MPPDAPTLLPSVVPPGRLTRALREQIEREIAEAIPEGKRGVVVALADQEAATVGVATRIGSSWKLSADVSRTWRGKVSGQVKVIGVW